MSKDEKMRKIFKIITFTLALNALLLALTACGECEHESARTVRENEIQPTCIADGSYDEVKYCEECDATLSITQKTVSAKGHTEEAHSAKAPSCTDAGWNAYVTCEDCEYTTYDEISPSHSIIEHQAKAPSCTEVGWNAYQTCANCNYTTYAEIGKTNHREIPHDAKAPTCTEIGWEAYVTCEDCDYSTYSEISKSQHDLVTHNAKDNSCTEIGWDEYRLCKDCTYTTFGAIPAIGHDYDGYTCLNCQTSLTPSEGLKYALSSDETHYIISGIGVCQDENIVIPLEYAGLPVSVIDWGAFSNCNNIKSVTILENITTIRSYAFSYCKNLESISIAESVTLIEDDAFADCTGLKAVHISDLAAWCNISFGDSYANPVFFAGHLYVGGNLLRTLIIPRSVTSIGAYAFTGCSDLLSVTVHEDVTDIGWEAFNFCNSLIEVINKSELDMVRWTDGNGSIASNASLLHSGDSKIVNIDGYLFVTDQDNKNLLIGYIGNETDLVLPKSYNGEKYQIPEYGFCNNQSITSIILPDCIEYIMYASFAGCENLVRVVISEGVKEIVNQAFAGCINLVEITIPKSVVGIWEYAFDECNSLTDVYYPAGEGRWNSIAISGGNSDLTEATIHYNCITLE